MGAGESDMTISRLAARRKAEKPHMQLGYMADGVTRKPINLTMWKRLGGQWRRAKLTDLNVLEMRERYRLGETAELLALEFSISIRQAYLIMAGKKWKVSTGGIPVIHLPQGNLSGASE